MVDEKPKKTGIIELLRYSIKNINWFKAVQKRDKTRKPIFLAYRELNKLEINNPILPRRIKEYNQAVIDYYSGKFLGSEAGRTGNKQLWKRAFKKFDDGKR